jgi:hypothetical protein
VGNEYRIKDSGEKGMKGMCGRNTGDLGGR